MTSRGPILITGGAGFIGSNLADRLASDGQHVLVFDALARRGVVRNLEWLMSRHPSRITPIIADIRDATTLGNAVGKARAVFHLAAQVAVTTSLDAPRDDFTINMAATVDLLEALRAKGDGTPVIFASTNKVYGALQHVPLELLDDAWQPTAAETRAHGIDEATPLDFHTPYGCSKGAADQYVLEYARSFGVPACVLRMSCIYGPRQMGTEDQGWVAHFLMKAHAGETITLFGDGRQVRDILHVSDAVNAYVAALSQIDWVSGRAFNLGGGPANAVSLLRLLQHIKFLTGRPVRTEHRDWRAGDQRYFVTDRRLVARELGLAEPLGWQRGVADLARWLDETHGSPPQKPHVVGAAA